MTVNASNNCGGAAALLTPVAGAAGATAQPGTPATATTAASVFLAMLAGMTAEAPVAATVLPQVAAGEDTEAPPEPSDTPLDAATQALIAALTPPVPAPATAAAMTKPATNDDTSSDKATGAAAMTGDAAESATLLQLADATRAVAVADRQLAAEQRLPDAGKSALIAVALDAALPGEHSDADDQLANGSNPPLSASATLSATFAATPAANGGLVFNPLQLVTQLDRAVAQTSGADQAPQTLQHPVGSAHWAEELGSRLTLMAGQGQQSGSLRLTPEHLGPLEVRIDINDDVANVFFGSQHADTRSALNEALPRLRELFAASGLVLGDTGVSRDTPRQDTRAADPRRYSTQGQDTSSINTDMQVSASVRHAGLLDTYA
ncbi:MAG: flagellar hook-length control protein FliK [Pseudomonadota bacterium]